MPGDVAMFSRLPHADRQALLNQMTPEGLKTCQPYPRVGPDGSDRGQYFDAWQKARSLSQEVEVLTQAGDAQGVKQLMQRDPAAWQSTALFNSSEAALAS